MNDQPDKPKPKLHIDSDWKAQARAEKERLAEKEKTQPKAGAAGPGGMPEANFKTLLSSMVTQALFAMGAIPDPQTGRRVAMLDLAQHHIDMLDVLQQKTKGNLEEEESKMLDEALRELKVNMTALTQHAMASQGKAAMGNPPGAGGGPGMGGAGGMPRS